MATKKRSGYKQNPPLRLPYFIPAALWGCLILYFSFIPGKEVPRFLVSISDKSLHAAIYFFGAALIYLGFVRFNFQNNLSRVAVVLMLLICIFFGGLIEVVQHYFIPKRAGEWLDFLANITGASVSVLLMRFLHLLKA